MQRLEGSWTLQLGGPPFVVFHNEKAMIRATYFLFLLETPNGQADLAQLGERKTEVLEVPSSILGVGNSFGIFFPA